MRLDVRVLVRRSQSLNLCIYGGGRWSIRLHARGDINVHAIEGGYDVCNGTGYVYGNGGGYGYAGQGFNSSYINGALF